MIAEPEWNRSKGAFALALGTLALAARGSRMSDAECALLTARRWWRRTGLIDAFSRIVTASTIAGRAVTGAFVRHRTFHPKRAAMLLAVAFLTSCGQAPATNNSSTERAINAASPVARPGNYFFKLNAHPVSPTKVELTVTTNAPLPMNVNASFGLAGLKNNETWLGGEMETVTLQKPTTIVIIDATQDGQELPKGRYVAEVESYDVSDLDRLPQFSAQQELRFGRSGNAVQVRRKNAMQRWVMGEMDFNQPWTDHALTGKLGAFERGRSSEGSFTYYFPEADLTLFVAPGRHKVFTFKLGRVS